MESSKRLITAAILAAGLSVTTLGAFAQSADGPAQRVIVKWRTQLDPTSLASPSQALSDAAGRLGVTTTSLRTLATGADVVRLNDRVTQAQLRDFISTLARNPAVEYVEEDRLLQHTLTPNDPGYSSQWHYFEATGGIRAPTAWDISTGAGVTVAVIDTGYRPHADLTGKFVGGYDFISDTFVANDGNGRDADAQDPGDWDTGQCGTPPRNSSWHGTHVSGTIAAVTNNASGVAGVAFGARIVPARVLGRCGGYTSDIADAVTWSSGGTVAGVPANAFPARVINMSLGGSGACSATMQNAINGARSRGTAVVVAAGNSNQNAVNFNPANCAGVIAVASTNRAGSKAYYSNFGTVVDFAAPGGETNSSAANGVLSTLNTGTTVPGADAYAYYQGTSMAAPHVAGVAALMISRNSALTPDQVEARMRTTARPFPGTCIPCGSGIVDATAAL